MTPTPLLLVEDPRPGVRRLTLNRPEKRNALSNELRGAILAALQEADADAAVKVSILRGAGVSFSSGYDFANRAVPAAELEAAVLAVAERIALVPTGLSQINKRAVHRAMKIMGLRAAIRAGTELQALAFTTAASQAYRAQFKRDGGSVRDLLSQRDKAFGDYREGGTSGSGG